MFSALPAGTYTVRATLTGFKTFQQTDLRVGTQQFLTLDITLDVGTLEETITVTGQSALIETSNASTGTLLNTETMATLPSAARTAFMMGTTVPTVVPSGDTQYNRQQDQTNVALMSLGGGTRRGNNYTLDGVPITDMRNRASAHPSIESLEDVKVQVHTYDAEMGRTGGGVFNTTLKSGTNSFRGNGSTRCGRSGGRPTTTSARSPAVRSRRARTASRAAPSAAPSSRTRRSSGSRPKATTTRRRETSARCFRPPRCGAATSRV